MPSWQEFRVQYFMLWPAKMLFCISTVSELLVWILIFSFHLWVKTMPLFLSVWVTVTVCNQSQPFGRRTGWFSLLGTLVWWWRNQFLLFLRMLQPLPVMGGLLTEPWYRIGVSSCSSLAPGSSGYGQYLTPIGPLGVCGQHCPLTLPNYYQWSPPSRDTGRANPTKYSVFSISYNVMILWWHGLNWYEVMQTLFSPTLKVSFITTTYTFLGY